MLGKLFVLTLLCAVAVAQPQNVAVGWSSTESSGAGMSGGGSNVQSSAGDPWGGSGSSGAGNAGVQGGFFSNPVAQGPVTAVDETPDVPMQFSLDQNYPNPFNPSTTVLFTLPRASATSLIIYNVLGQEVARPVDGWREAGLHTVQIDASGWPSGVYFYDLKSDGSALARKMMLIR